MGCVEERIFLRNHGQWLVAQGFCPRSQRFEVIHTGFDFDVGRHHLLAIASK
jgi:hypothetical protein